MSTLNVTRRAFYSTILATVLAACGVVVSLGAFAQAPPTAAPEANLSGRYLCLLKGTQNNGAGDDEGVIVITQNASGLAITAGPTADQQLVAEQIKRAGNTLTFDLKTPAEVPTVMKFDLTIADRQLTGKVTRIRDGEQMTVVIEGTRQ